MPLSTVAGVLGVVGAGMSIDSQMDAKKAGKGGRGGAVSAWNAGGGGNQAASQLQQLIAGGPQSIYQDTAFQQHMQFGQDATQRKLAAQGMHLSGNEKLALNRSAMNSGLDFYNQQIAHLSALSGAEFNPATGAQVQAGIDQNNWKALGQGLGTLGQNGGNDLIRDAYQGIQDWWNGPSTAGASPGGVPVTYDAGAGYDTGNFMFTGY